jgi:hypothetical protein
MVLVVLGGAVEELVVGVDVDVDVDDVARLVDAFALVVVVVEKGEESEPGTQAATNSADESAATKRPPNRSDLPQLIADKVTQDL